MQLSKIQLEQVDAQIKRLISNDNYYGNKYVFDLNSLNLSIFSPSKLA